MIEKNSESTSANQISPDLVDRAVHDLDEGLKTRSLAKFLDDVDQTRRSNPEALKGLLSAVSEKMPQAYKGMVLADSGKAHTLAVEDAKHQHGATFREDGKPLSYYKPVVHAEPASVGDLTAKPFYTAVSPPGLAELKPGEQVKGTGKEPDYTLDGNKALQKGGKFGVLDREVTSSTVNPDGSMTYNYTGKLDSSFTGDGGNGYTLVKTGNVGFTASETVSPDGKLLSRHVDYQPAGQKRTLEGFMLELGPGVDTNQKRTLPVLRAGFPEIGPANANDVLSLDTKFDPATSRYETTAKYMGGRKSTITSDAQGEDIALSSSSCQYSYAGESKESGERRNAAGFVIADNNPVPGAYLDREEKVTIKRDQNNEVIEFSDARGRTSKRIDGDNWQGPDGLFKAEVFADNAGDIVEKSQEGIKIVDRYGGDTWLDNSGTILKSQSMEYEKGLTIKTYQFDVDKNETGYKEEHDRKNYDGSITHVSENNQHKATAASKLHIPLLTLDQDYCLESK